MKKKQDGVTLIELMITVTIVAILAAIAYPSYRNQILRSNRSVAKTALLDYAQRMERCFTQTFTYVGCAASTGIGTNTSGFDSGRSFYAITFNPATTATTYSLVATAQGSQTDDNACATFTIDQTGSRTPTSGCW